MKLTQELTMKLAAAAADSYHLVYSGGDLAAIHAAAVDHTISGIVAVFGIEIDDGLRETVERHVDFKLDELEVKRKRKRA